MGLMGPVVGRLYDKVGPTVLAVPGAVLVSAVMWALTMVGQDTSVWALLAGHIVISIGLALIFTPVFTSSMGSVRMELYSHASAVLGSVQQLAGAAGIALFIALMTIRTAALTAEGATPVDALAAGIRLAFLVGAVISLGAVLAAFFIRKPEGGGPAHGSH
jgi:DHA2 family lincomycin resistance protein-like MFS transporter